MNKASKLYTILIIILTHITFAALAVSSLGVVFRYKSLVYFWYLALSGIVLIITTSFIFGIVLVLDSSIKYLRHAHRTRAKAEVGIASCETGYQSNIDITD